MFKDGSKVQTANEKILKYCGHVMIKLNIGHAQPVHIVDWEKWSQSLETPT